MFNKCHVIKLANAVLSLALSLFAAGPVMADPSDFRFTSLPDFEQAYNQGDILPVYEWNEGLEGLHPGQEEFYRPPDLYVLEDLDTEEGFYDPNAGLLMTWGEPADTEDIIAAWELVLPEDPDLTNMCIMLNAWPRNGMTSISFSLKDVNGVMKGWRWPAGPGGLPWNTSTTLTVAAAGGPGQAGSTGFWDGGIDLTRIVSFEFDESGIAQGGIPLPNNLPGFVGQWNYWHNIIVFACPPTRPEHFACYKVDEKSKLDRTIVTLSDQFIEDVNVEVRKAREICTPADKNGEGIVDPQLHLVCYDVKSPELVNQRVEVENQFGVQLLRVKEHMQRLCVPSLKTVIK